MNKSKALLLSQRLQTWRYATFLLWDKGNICLLWTEYHQQTPELYYLSKSFIAFLVPAVEILSGVEDKGLSSFYMSELTICRRKWKKITCVNDGCPDNGGKIKEADHHWWQDGGKSSSGSLFYWLFPVLSFPISGTFAFAWSPWEVWTVKGDLSSSSVNLPPLNSLLALPRSHSSARGSSARAKSRNEVCERFPACLWMCIEAWHAHATVTAPSSWRWLPGQQPITVGHTRARQSGWPGHKVSVISLEDTSSRTSHTLHNNTVHNISKETHL